MAAETACNASLIAPLNSDDLHTWLYKRGAEHSIVSLPTETGDTTATVVMVKSMVLVVEPLDQDAEHLRDNNRVHQGELDTCSGEPLVAVLVLVAGSARLDLRAVAVHLGVQRRQLRLATPQEAVIVTGYSVGCIPPCGAIVSFSAPRTT